MRRNGFSLDVTDPSRAGDQNVGTEGDLVADVSHRQNADMNRSRSIVAALSLVLLAGACSSDDSGDKAGGSSPSGSASSSASPTPGSSGSQGSSGTTTTKPRVVAEKSGPAAKKWIAKNYDGAWVDEIKDVSVKDNVLIAQTKLSKKGAEASEICKALASYGALKLKGGFTPVKVESSKGKTLVERKTLAQPC